MLYVAKNKFEKNCIDVRHLETIMCLSFEGTEIITEMEKTNIGQGFRIFYIRNNLNTGLTEIEWSNNACRFKLESKDKYNMKEK